MHDKRDEMPTISKSVLLKLNISQITRQKEHKEPNIAKMLSNSLA